MNPVSLKRSFEEEVRHEYTSKKQKHTPAEKTLKRCRAESSDSCQEKTTKKIAVNTNAEASVIDNTYNRSMDELTLLFSRLKISDPTASIEQMALAPVDTMKFWVEALWAQNEVMIVEENGETELTCSLILQKTLTDTQLEYILKKSDISQIQQITYINVQQCPCLTAKSASLLLTHCPLLKRHSFRNIRNENFYDLFLRKENKEIAINSHLVGHFSTYLKQILDSMKIPDKTNYYSKDCADLPDCIFSAIEDCMHILSGSYELKDEPNLVRKLFVLKILLSFEFISILEVYEDTIIEAIHLLHEKNQPKALQALTQQITDYLSNRFSAGMFPSLNAAIEMMQYS